jgi:hypothetical protein
MLPQGGQLASERVICQTKDQDGNLIGKAADTNHLLGISIVDDEFEDGHVEAYIANLIAENMYGQVDSEEQDIL